MNRRGVAALVVAVALAAASCADTDDADTDDTVEPPPLVTVTEAAGDGSTTTTDPLPAASVEQVDCPDDLGRRDGLALACGVVTVPIDRRDPGEGSTRITVATLDGYDAGFETPLAVLQGGPGGASTDFGTWLVQQPFTQVFVDQRGTGFAGPDFDCVEFTDSLGRILASPFDTAAQLAGQAYDDCARRLGRDLVLRHTDTESHTADVADVMAALGYDRWVVYGVSYGSTIALELLRTKPDGMVGAVLDGVYPPQLDADAGLVASASRALDELDRACSLESVCRRYLSDGSVRDTLERVMEELDDDPMRVALPGNRIGFDENVELVLDGRRVAELLFPLMYHETFLRHLPAVIGGLDDRDLSSARWLAVNGARTVIASTGANDEGTFFAVQCHDRLPFTNGPGVVDDPFAAAVAAAPLAELCDEWERGAAPPETDEPVTSDLPVLLLSGTFDPITPPSYAEEAAATLSAATLVEQGGRSHGIWVGDSCIAEIVQRFVADPARTLDPSCAAVPVSVEWARP